MLATYGKPVLYVDADCEFVDVPVAIDRLVDERCDFAVYNWCTDDCTDQFVPFEIGPPSGEVASKRRYYRYLGALDISSRDQLVCSGLVQFYADSYAGRGMLARWHRTIADFPGCADDGALAFAYNNLTRRMPSRWILQARWLPKSYARIAWWIYVKPVINHEDIPTKANNTVPISDPKGRKTFYPSSTISRVLRGPLPRDCIIDTKRRILCKLVNKELVPIGPCPQQLWL